ncbi:adenosylcobinamide-GDP ribazoletransferase [Hirschia baltica]|uniref:Adenosylcobinamide-GDP ribazoletransferase n=1 Tax=Hirschia baltica (strain ATCC 49814 / DSM 5838 / IFAM 1418) TaxID=582402 RepID=C6XM01_HIRBI|nr:adenosylcobinamide-GDP ribazoletransferase [Hirschia baltica]ACT59833.1 cobalamin 5'-phosphate synthase [Hirschia baltica ATCC 49814]
MILFLRNEISIFLIAVQFLTRIPLPRNIGFTQKRLASSPRYFPLVGLAIGSIGAIAYFLSSHLFPPVIAIVISTIITCLLTGGFHEDGLADTFDGIGGGHTKERALDIMKDSRIGTYGSLALGLMLALKIMALSALPHLTIIIAIIAAHGLSRLSSVMVIATSSYVRDHGTGKHTSDGIHIAGLILALLTGTFGLSLLVLFLPLASALSALVGCLAGHILMRAFFEKKLSGYTGDTLGAVQQSSEVGIYLALLSCL